MTQSAGAESASTETTADDEIVADIMNKRARGDRSTTTLPPLDEDTATFITTGTALLERFVEQHPKEADLLAQVLDNPDRVESCIADAVDRGPVKHGAPWTEAEADQMITWWVSPPTDEELGLPPVSGLHGPECRCTGDMDQDMDTLAGLLTDAIMGAVGGGPTVAYINGAGGPGEAAAEAIRKAMRGRTPAETRTGVSDAEAAILTELSSMAVKTRQYGEATQDLGAAIVKAEANPFQEVMAVMEAVAKANSVIDSWKASARLIESWLPRVRGVQATDADGHGLYLHTDEDGHWLVTATVPEEGAEGFQAIYIR